MKIFRIAYFFRKIKMPSFSSNRKSISGDNTQETHFGSNALIAQSIFEYLKSTYCEEESAILLNGKWGSGKTHLMRDLIAKLDPETKKRLAIVSLYGCTTVTELEERVLYALIPLIDKITASTLGNITESIIKNTSGFNFNFNGIKDLLQIGGKKLFASQKIVVLEDFERCNIPHDITIGYLNTLMHTYSMKMVVVADESKIEKEVYLEHKEKFISKSFKIIPDIRKVVENDISKNDNKELAASILNQLDEVISVFNISGLENLRLYKKAISYCFRYLENLPNYILKNEQFVLRTFIQFSIYLPEIEANNIKIQDMELVNSSLYFSDKSEKDIRASLKDKPDEADAVIRVVETIRKYPHQYQKTLAIPANVFIEFLEIGIVDKETKQNFAMLTDFFGGSFIQPPYNLVRYYEYELEHFQKQYSRLLSFLSSNDTKSASDIVDSAIMLLFFYQMKIHNKSLNDIEEIIDKSIENLCFEKSNTSPFFHDLSAYQGKLNTAHISILNRIEDDIKSRLDTLSVENRDREIKQILGIDTTFSLSKYLRAIQAKPHEKYSSPFLDKKYAIGFSETLAKESNFNLKMIDESIFERSKKYQGKYDSFMTEINFYDCLASEIQKTVSNLKNDPLKASLLNGIEATATKIAHTNPTNPATN